MYGTDKIQFESEFPAKAAEEEKDEVLCVGRALFVRPWTNTSFPGAANLRGGGVPLYGAEVGPARQVPGIGPLVAGGCVSTPGLTPDGFC